MKPRPDGFHVTILDIEETRVAEERMTPRVLRALNMLNENIKQGKGISLEGIGYIDGSKEAGTGVLRDVDTKKKVAFINIDSPLATVIRKELGLDDKQLRITLGYEGGDIRYHVAGQDEKGKRVLKPVTRRLDYEGVSALDRKFGAGLDKRLNVKFGEIDGPDKKEKKGKK
ncbi:MAG: hypothetical protein HY226_06135 [Candidatus Vogelbacteria bacterium]|nr:hypothetical protein [Candidatus Vogelbacteria bacterium]